jgi:hypothetical protein
VEQSTCEAIRELGYHVVVLERGVTITPQLIAAIESQVKAFEQEADKLSPPPFFINTTGKLQ